MKLRSNVLFQPGPIIFLQVLPDDLVPVLDYITSPGIIIPTLVKNSN